MPVKQMLRAVPNDYIPVLHILSSFGVDKRFPDCGRIEILHSIHNDGIFVLLHFFWIRKIMKELKTYQISLAFAGCFLGAGFISGQELW